MKINTRSKFGTFLLGPKYEARSAGNPNGDGMLPGVVPPARAVNVGVMDALSISAVYRAVDILGNWIGPMALGVSRYGETLPVPTLVSQPDTDVSGFHFIRTTVVSLALDGNAFWKVTRRQSDGAPLNLEVLNPYLVSVETNSAGKRVYRYADKAYTPRQVLHLATMQVPGRLRGLGPIEANRSGLAGMLALRNYADNWFGASGVPKGGYLKSSQDLDSDQLTEARTRWLGQMNDGLPPALGNDFTYQSVSLNPADAMFLEQQQYAVTDVARWFGIPPTLMLASVDGNSMTYSNLQTDARLFVTSTLMGYMMPIQEAFSSLLPRGQVVTFDTTSLLRADTEQRYAANKLAIEAGFKTIDEVRAEEGLPPLQPKETNNEAA